MIKRLLYAGADLSTQNDSGETRLTLLQKDYPSHPAALAILQQHLDAERASFLIKKRCFVMTTTDSSNVAVSSFAKGRVECGLPLPGVALARVADGENNDELRFMAFLTGVEGGGMPRDVFRIVVDFVMPPWDPLLPKPQGKRGQPRWEYEPERL